jgi:hypothetical protein
VSDVRIRIEGESYLTLEAISECYECEVAWLREAYDFGLLGGGRTYSGTLVFSITILDRVAEVVRLGRYQGLGFDAIVLLLGEVSAQPRGGWVDTEA